MKKSKYEKIVGQFTYNPHSVEEYESWAKTLIISRKTKGHLLLTLLFIVASIAAAIWFVVVKGSGNDASPAIGLFVLSLIGFITSKWWLNKEIKYYHAATAGGTFDKKQCSFLNDVSVTKEQLIQADIRRLEEAETSSFVLSERERLNSLPKN